jgi:hypothetical protein
MNAFENAQERPRGANGDGRIADRSAEEIQHEIEQRRHRIDDTLLELENRLSPGELLDEAVRYMKSGPGEMVMNFGRAAKQNPMPLALTGIGLAWLMMGQRQGTSEAPRTQGATPQPEYREPPSASALYAQYLTEEYAFEEDEVDCILYDDLGPEQFDEYRAYTIAPGASDVGSQAGHRSWKDRAGNAAARVSGAASSAGGRVSEMSQEARERAREFADETRVRMDSVRSRMAAAGDETAARIRRARDVAWRRAQRARAATAVQAQRAVHQAEDLFERYPLSLIALGVAAGAALGSALPESRRENRVMGETSDKLKQQAGSRLREGAEQVRHGAAAARDAAVSEAKAQGLSAESLRREGQALREKAKRVVEAARGEAEKEHLTSDAARDEIHRAKEKVENVAAAARDAAARETTTRNPG